ncbi:hypothetical protein [Caldifermentibacillus hisashii]|uniref:hypothetical protein n=1 Tax=Caldifermentibacillus hisashii TaxID=996558 RepID=UPI001C11FD2E|nr:hypothetical protein [Caldifermentibacillus hisashii]MBU5342308.1 hypothetical protein [Caldifermentibacillus hisashii]
MMHKERLEEIKEAYRWTIDNSLVPRLSDSDTEWLINRVKELEEEVEKQKNRKYLKMRQRDDFMKKAQRYKQALEFYADKENYFLKQRKTSSFYTPIELDKGEKARQALEGDDD